MTDQISGSLSMALHALGYSDSDDLVTVGDSMVTGSRTLTSRDYLWRDLRAIGLDAAFFYDGVPLVGFSGDPPGDGLSGLRRRLWNYGRVPILIAASEAEIDAYNATSLPDSSNQGHLFELLHRRNRTARDLASAFHRKYVADGTFKSQFSGSYRPKSRVDQGLLRNLKYLRNKIGGRSDESRAALDNLISACITASYLIARGGLDEEQLQDLTGTPSLVQSLRRGRMQSAELFSRVAERFSGDVFESVLPAIAQVDDTAFTAMAALLRGDDLPSGQGSLWPYDFSVLPSDLISNVYEQLLEDRRKQDSAYYTPRPIVDLILDEVVSWDGEQIPTLIDLACGSGAFLTEAFRRIAFKARWRKGDDLTYPELRKILTDHIFGIDVNPDAAKVAAFGAYLALLEEVDPPNIWMTVKLPPIIGTNIIISDAFGEHILRGRTFDAVVGNPPWKEGLSRAADLFICTQGVPIARKQVAQAFVWLANEFLRPGGALGLVLPAKSVLHNRSVQAQEFRAALFGQLNIDAVIDLSPIRRELFQKAINPPSVLVGGKPPRGGGDGIIHITVRPRPSAAEFGPLVIAPEDLTIVPLNQARYRTDVWKTLVWGTPRDLAFLDRVRAKQPTLGEVLEMRGWKAGQGYKDAPNLQQQDSSFLIGLPVIDIDAVLPLRRPDFLSSRFSQTTLHRPRTLEQYQAPQVIIRRTLPEGRLAATFLAEDAVYTSELLSISGPSADADFLRLVAAVISSSFGNYWQFMTSASWGVERDTVEKNELLAMPLPCASLDEIDSALMNQVITLATPRVGLSPELIKELDDAVFDLFKFSAPERRRIDAGISGYIARFQEANHYRFFADDSDINSYTETIRVALGRSMADVQIRTGFARDNNYITVWVSFSDNYTEVASLASVIVDTEAIMRSGGGPAAGTTGLTALPAAFLIEEDTAYIVKTSDRDRWSYDAALNDAERIFSVLAFGEE